jgi:hypothetical protein
MTDNRALAERLLFESLRPIAVESKFSTLKPVTLNLFQGPSCRKSSRQCGAVDAETSSA